MLGIKRKSIVSITHFLVVERFYFNNNHNSCMLKSKLRFKLTI